MHLSLLLIKRQNMQTKEIQTTVYPREKLRKEGISPDK